MWRGVRKQKSKVGSRCSACRQIQLNAKKTPAGAGFFFNFQAITRERSRCESASVCKRDAVQPEL